MEENKKEQESKKERLNKEFEAAILTGAQHLASDLKKIKNEKAKSRRVNPKYRTIKDQMNDHYTWGYKAGGAQIPMETGPLDSESTPLDQGPMITDPVTGNLVPVERMQTSQQKEATLEPKKLGDGLLQNDFYNDPYQSTGTHPYYRGHYDSGEVIITTSDRKGTTESKSGDVFDRLFPDRRSSAGSTYIPKHDYTKPTHLAPSGTTSEGVDPVQYSSLADLPPGLMEELEHLRGDEEAYNNLIIQLGQNGTFSPFLTEVLLTTKESRASKVSRIMSRFMSDKRNMQASGDNVHFHAYLESLNYPKPYPNINLVRDIIYDGKALHITYDDFESATEEREPEIDNGPGYRVQYTGSAKRKPGYIGSEIRGNQVFNPVETVPVEGGSGISNSTFRVKNNSA